ncbi:MAG: hypothetical protein AABX37_00430 [Nanoarchaeota archaeon]
MTITLHNFYLLTEDFAYGRPHPRPLPDIDIPTVQVVTLAQYREVTEKEVLQYLRTRAQVISQVIATGKFPTFPRGQNLEATLSHLPPQTRRAIAQGDQNLLERLASGAKSHVASSHFPQSYIHIKSGRMTKTKAQRASQQEENASWYERHMNQEWNVRFPYGTAGISTTLSPHLTSSKQTHFQPQVDEIIASLRKQKVPYQELLKLPDKTQQVLIDAAHITLLSLAQEGIDHRTAVQELLGRTLTWGRYTVEEN